MLWKLIVAVAIPISSALAEVQLQKPFMAPEEAHGQVWSLCGDSSSHLLRSYKGGVSVIPEYPKVGEEIQVMVNGYLDSPVTGGDIGIDLKLLSLIKVNKKLDLCSALNSDIMDYQGCPLTSGDVTLKAHAYIPKDVPRLPLNGDIHITDQDGNTVTCIHLDFKLQ
ncbi:hypothetical protein INT43_000212 [Umbelopsis isabellina]|uniref:Phosphatidylglycerol/phosphatidylinositol transfer protein n=1 Tax=Mortierella isabellina TaxID=91625 RepID=A0A8H7PF94_MORIS|nr:hypothetical protein INT43_000212 [Umbelopsis isabellina]